MSLIYVVEDDKNIREIEVIALKNSGFEVEEFETAGDFNKALDQKEPDLLLLDIMLPDADGLTIVKNIRQSKRGRQLPIILVTAKTTEIDKVRGLDIGADDYLTKPFGIMELISRVKALLRRTSKEQQEKVITIGQICMDDEKHRVTVNSAGCELTYKEYSWHSLTSKSNELIHVWTIGDFEKMRGYRYQAIFIQDDIYDHALADKVSTHAW